MRKRDYQVRKVLALFVLSLLISSCAKTPKISDENHPKILDTILRAPAGKSIADVSESEVSEMAKNAVSTGNNADVLFADNIFLKADDASLKGDSDTAVKLFQFLLQIRPDDYVSKRLAMEYIRKAEYKEAGKLLREIYGHAVGKDESTGLLLAGVHVAEGQREEAMKVYAEVLRQHPDSVEACVFLAKATALGGKISESLKLLGNCKKKNPGISEYDVAIGQILYENKDIKGALISFKEAIKIEPQNERAVMAAGSVLEEMGKQSEALKIYKDLVEFDPAAAFILERIISILFSRSEFSEAVPYMEMAAAINLDDQNLRVRLGIIYAESRHYEDAVRIFKELHQSFPDSDRVLYYLAAVYQEMGELDLAVNYYSKIPSKSPLFHDSCVRVAQILNMLAQGSSDSEYTQKRLVGRFNEYVEDQFKAVPQIRAELMMIKANYYELRKEYPSAIESLQRVQEDAKSSVAHEYYLASLYDKGGNYLKAVETIHNVLKKEPDHAHALNFLGYIMLEKGDDIETAGKYIKRAVKLKPDDGFIRDSLGWYYYLTGKYKKALKELALAKVQSKNDVVILKHLALTYHALCKQIEARKMFYEALAQSGTDEEKKSILDEINQIEKRLPASETAR
jgi:tetratricopeptide (TPR) repeat protein